MSQKQKQKTKQITKQQEVLNKIDIMQKKKTKDKDIRRKVNKEIEKVMIEKFSVLFKTPEETKEYIGIVRMLFKNKIGLKLKKNQTFAQAQVEWLLRVQYCAVVGIPFSLISFTYVGDNGAVKAMTDGEMYLVAKNCPTSEFNVIESTKKICTIETRRSKNHPWMSVTWTIEKAKEVVGGFGKKPLWKWDPEDMLATRCYGSLCGIHYRKEISGVGRGYLSTEEINNLGMDIVNGDENDKPK